jgi:2-polyprenyl-6-methoxyphenol hydroxylase-like FAD-dependent oxidoreductase
LVVGADGPHSTVRTLVFGPEKGFVQHHLGLYIATLPLGRPAADSTTILDVQRAGSYADDGWHPPDLPDRLRAADDL